MAETLAPVWLQVTGEVNEWVAMLATLLDMSHLCIREQDHIYVAAEFQMCMVLNCFFPDKLYGECDEQGVRLSVAKEHIS